MSSSLPRKKKTTGTSYRRDARLLDGGGHEPRVPRPKSTSTLMSDERDASGNEDNRNDNEEVALRTLNSIFQALQYTQDHLLLTKEICVVPIQQSRGPATQI